jgi:hypothetical protein
MDIARAGKPASNRKRGAGAGLVAGRCEYTGACPGANEQQADHGCRRTADQRVEFVPAHQCVREPDDFAPDIPEPPACERYRRLVAGPALSEAA